MYASQVAWPRSNYLGVRRRKQGARGVICGAMATGWNQRSCPLPSSVSNLHRKCCVLGNPSTFCRKGRQKGIGEGEGNEEILEEAGTEEIGASIGEETEEVSEEVWTEGLRKCKGGRVGKRDHENGDGDGDVMRSLHCEGEANKDLSSVSGRCDLGLCTEPL
eukprot:1159454-Pelagomonas_calceolata.AAC.7